MSTPAAGDLRPARLRLWSNRLWILAGLLGAAVLWSGGRLIHDERLRRDTLRALADDKATEVANLGFARFNLLVSNTFTPVWDGRASQPSVVLGELANTHAQGLACRCRETLPVMRFFRFDASTTAPFDAGTERLSSIVVGNPDSVADSTLTRIAHNEFDRGMRTTVPVREVTLAGKRAILTITQPARSGPGTKVYGAIMPVAGLAAALFGGFPRDFPNDSSRGRSLIPPTFAHGPEAHVVHMDRHRRLVQLDTLGLGVAAGPEHIFGSLADRPYMGTATLPAPIDEFRVFTALTGSQISLGLLMPVAHDRLWWNGILILATIVVSLFAIGASRREVSLARARSDFVAGISHDLRMPLAQILLAAETLSLGRDRNEAERSTLMGSILREARRLKTMVDNVLLFSRSGAVGIEPRLQAVDAASLFTAVAESVDLALADAAQTIETEAAEGLRMTADRALLHQALVNLVDNAMKYGPKGQRIRLRAETHGATARVIVEDEGPGIPPDARARLFEPYERLSRDSTSERTGTGLGLAVVRQIVLACSGHISIEDATQGARIVISLPLAP